MADQAAQVTAHGATPFGVARNFDTVTSQALCDTPDVEAVFVPGEVLDPVEASEDRWTVLDVSGGPRSLGHPARLFSEVEEDAEVRSVVVACGVGEDEVKSIILDLASEALRLEGPSALATAHLRGNDLLHFLYSRSSELGTDQERTWLKDTIDAIPFSELTYTSIIIGMRELMIGLLLED